MREYRLLGTRLLGVGLAAALAAVTIVLAVTGRIGLYINPESSWFAVSMSVILLIGAALSFALPLGAEADHGHDHGDAHGPAEHAPGVSTRRSAARSATDHAHVHAHAPVAERPQRDEPLQIGRTLSRAATLTGGVLATGIVGAILLMPPASLSAELAMSRDTGAPPLFRGADAVALATTGDTTSFGVGDWAAVFATATNPDAFDGDTVTLTGFVTPGGADGFDLSRLVITHCVIDAQSANVPISAADVPETGQWVTVTGTVRASADGSLAITAAEVTTIDEPEDPYEY